jgi:hypothetical protein
MTKAEKDIDDINFIINEIIRFASMEVHDLSEFLEENTVPNPSGSEVYRIGEAASRRFYELASRHLSTRPDLNNNFDRVST